MVFTEQKRWGDEYNPYGAIYQLNWAVKVADERYKKEGFYQPLLAVKQLRVSVYQAAGHPEKAHEALWQSILATIDSEELEPAEKALADFPKDAEHDKDALGCGR